MENKIAQECSNLGIEETFEKLGSSFNGLTETQVVKRIEEFGLNVLPEEKRFSALKLFLLQFKNLFVIVLIFAAIVSLFLGGEEHFIDAVVIIGIILLIVLLGFWQEFKAEKAMLALKKMAALHAKVLRNGKKIEINAENLVPGDIVFLETGGKVPADLRLIEAFNLKIDEAVLTGESEPVTKNTETLQGKKAISEMHNLAFSNTPVVYGRGTGVVIATGSQTEFGKIAGLIKEIKEEETPLKQRLEVLAKQLSVAITVVIALIFALQYFLGILADDLTQTILTAIALWVAAVPEGLPAVVTITLAIGVLKMGKNNAIVKRMPSVESLGSTTVICTDKTGTITRNEMVTERIFADGKTFAITGEGYRAQGEFLFNGMEIDLENENALDKLLEIGLNCNDALLGEKDTIFGDPTEAALVVAAAKAGKISKLQRLDEIPFDSERKMMTTIHLVNGKKMAFIKGAPEKILSLSSKIYLNGEIMELGEKEKKELEDIEENFAEKAYRVLGFGFKEIGGGESDKEIESEIVFVGFSAMSDPPRKEIKAAVETCKTAGIQIKIITGDNPLTAKAVAEKIGLTGKTITGKGLDNLSKEEFSRIVKETTVFSRVNPSHKFKIVEELKNQGEIVSVTGDGVNDAPALKKADVGIAMGIKGTDVTKESADMILKDDNFATIITAIKEGRRIYANIKKFIKYLLAANFGEILAIGFATIARLPLPLLAAQILWINLATDSLPALALGLEKAEPDAMKKPPRNPKTGILKPIFSFVLIAGILAGLVTIASFVYGMQFDENSFDQLIPSKGRTMAFTALVLFEMVFVFACRSEKKLPHQISPLSNRKLVLAVIFSLFFQVIVVNVLPILPEINSIDMNFFKVVPLNLLDWGIILVLSLSALTVPYIDKFVKRLLPEKLLA